MEPLPPTPYQNQMRLCEQASAGLAIAFGMATLVTLMTAHRRLNAARWSVMVGDSAIFMIWALARALTDVMELMTKGIPTKRLLIIAGGLGAATGASIGVSCWADSKARSGAGRSR